MPSALSVSQLASPAAARCSAHRRASRAVVVRPAQPAAATNLASSSRARPAGRRTAAVAPVAAAGGSRAGAAPPVKLTLPDGTSLAMPQAAMVVGSSAEADLQVHGPGVAAQHARLEWRSGRLFCTALAADPDLLLAPTHCWLDGVELRPGVNYMVAPGARIGIGTEDTCLACSFEEAGSSAVAEMMMKGLASTASKEVQDKLGGM